MKTEQSKVKANIEMIGASIERLHMGNIANAETLFLGMFIGGVIVGDGEGDDTTYERACRLYDEWRKARIDEQREKRIEEQIEFESQIAAKRKVRGLASV